MYFSIRSFNLYCAIFKFSPTKENLLVFLTSLPYHITDSFFINCKEPFSKLDKRIHITSTVSPFGVALRYITKDCCLIILAFFIGLIGIRTANILLGATQIIPLKE